MENNKKFFIYLLVIFFAVFVGSGIFLLMNNKKTTDSNEQAVSTSIIKQTKMDIPTPMPTKGLINLKNNSTDNNINNPVELSLVADSNQENVTAFDMIISYDQIAFDFLTAESLNPDFKIFSYKKDNRLTLTVVKIGQTSVPTVFRGEPVAKLVFQPKSKGDFAFVVLSSSGKETTKFVNEKTEIIYPGLNEVKVTIN